MGRKRKTRWRRLSIGEGSGNEDEETQELNGDGELINPRSASQSSLNNSSPGDTPPTMSSKTSLTEVYPKEGGGAPRTPTHSDENGSTDPHHSNSYHPHPHHHHQYHNGHPHPSSHHYGGKDKTGEVRDTTTAAPPHTNGSDRGYHNGGSHHHSGSNGYYQNSYYQRNSYNNYRNSHYEGRGGGGGGGGGDGGYQGGGGNGGSDYGYSSQSSRYGARFRKPRPYSSNYYYNNGTGAAQQGDTTNRPSYNQDEYTKITTPRQDVLFKKGYLSQRKPAAQSSVDSTSSATTPSASTNGTPDTHSTNGVSSDYSEGFENGETDNGIPPYDDTVYYGPPAEAVFTDPNTGQVYYGQCSSNGEYFDAYPVSSVVVAGYPSAPVYYQLSYPPMEWNGVPNPYVPVVAAAALPVVDDQLLSPALQIGEVQPNTWSTKNGDVEEVHLKKNGENGRSGSPLPAPEAKSASNGKRTGKDGVTTKGPSPLRSTSSSCSNSSSSPSSLASTPMSPPSNGGQIHSLPASMSNLSLSGSPSHLHHPHVLPHFLATVPPPPTHPHHQHGPQPPPHPFIYQHPGPGFVYGHPVFNGVVVPIAPTASAAAAASSSLEISSDSRKKRKKRRRKKDGQLTDESTDDDDESVSTISNSEADTSLKDKPESTNPNISSLEIKDLSLEKQPNFEETPENKESEANKKDLEEDSKPDLNEELLDHSQAELITISPALSKCENEPLTSDKDEASCKTAEPAGSQDIDTPTSDNSTEEKGTSSAEAESCKPSELGEPSTSALTPSIEKSASHKKPVDLTVICPFNLSQGSAFNDLQLLSLQRSPDGLEPSSPDSLNTNQSVAGSEIASVSESDLMNRTTSLDEVEEDLPAEEEELQFRTSSSSVQNNTSPNMSNPIKTPNASEEDAPMSPVSRPETVVSSKTWENNSPSFTPSESAEPSPSPETIFERQIEPSFETEEIILQTDTTEVYVPDCEFRSLSDTTLEPPADNYESGLSSPTLETHSQSIVSPTEELEMPESIEKIVADEAKLDVVYAPAEDIFEMDPEPPDVPLVPVPPINPCPAEDVPAIPCKVVESTNLAAERPTSITLAVSEWLKAQGDDALTPVSQLQAKFKAEMGEDDEDGDDEDDDESLKADDFENLEQNQKNVHGNPWVVPSNKSSQHHLTGLKVLRSKVNVSVDGICSRVACDSTASSSENSLTKTPRAEEENLTDEDSGLEHSSPETSPIKPKVPFKLEGRTKYEKDLTNSELMSQETMGLSQDRKYQKNSSATICDPQKFSKYYQFGVVFEKDQGIELDDELLSNEEVIPTTCRKVMLTCDFDDEDEELGTIVPVNSKLDNFSGTIQQPTRISKLNKANAIVQQDKTATTADANAKAFLHVYVNPFSLASEMETDTPRQSMSSHLSQDLMWDDAEPLPPYESPPPVEYPVPVFSHNANLNAKMIQSQDDQLGPLIPIPRAICCVIQ